VSTLTAEPPVLSQHSFESRAWGKRDEGREGPRAQLIAEHHSYPARWGSVCSMAFVSALLVGGVSAALLQGASPIGCWRGCRLSLMMWWGRHMRPATIAGCLLLLAWLWALRSGRLCQRRGASLPCRSIAVPF